MNANARVLFWLDDDREIVPCSQFTDAVLYSTLTILIFNSKRLVSPSEVESMRIRFNDMRDIMK